MSLKCAQWEAPEQEKVANVSGSSDSFRQEWETLGLLSFPGPQGDLTGRWRGSYFRPPAPLPHLQRWVHLVKQRAMAFGEDSLYIYTQEKSRKAV